ncbi:MAG: hypothetical protein EXR58_04790 [Chloroflexi bacterium]|nr:hypothetical protein [Chloroflexota bacterium]
MTWAEDLKLEAKEFLGDFQEFSEEDPFNGNFVEGLIGRRQGDAYGALLITRVNYQKALQRVLGTPKLGYPFDPAGRWHFPKAVRILAYEKLDGTNVFGYRYRDTDGKEYATWKPRLRPFLADGRFGPFLAMWREMLDRYPVLGWQVGNRASFELYGSRNLHLIKYETLLDTALLFTRDEAGHLLPPIQEPPGVPTAKLIAEVTQDYIWSYQEQQRVLSEGLIRQDDGTFTGSEGHVWYLLDELGKWHLFKLKPAEIEAIHWTEGRRISREVIRATALNLIESDPLTADGVALLLLEEFPSEEVDASQELISRVVREVAEHLEFRDTVLASYRALDLPWTRENQPSIMRALASQFRKQDMKRVYSALTALLGAG